MPAVKTVVVGSDHAAYDAKQMVVVHLQAKGLEVIDKGTHNGARCDYPNIAEAVCQEYLARSSGSTDAVRGIVLCGTGIGISIAANKVKGIRCALCHDHYTAKMCREHNDANVLSVGARTTGPEVIKEIVDTFLETAFEGERHQARVSMISALEHKPAL